MAVSPKDTHACEWKDRAEALETAVSGLKETLAQIQQDMATLTRRMLGPKSEKMSPIDKELREGESIDPEETQKRRRERRAQREQVEPGEVAVLVRCVNRP